MACNFNKKEIRTSSNATKSPALAINKHIEASNALFFINEYVRRGNNLEPVSPENYTNSSHLVTQTFKSELTRILSEARKRDSLVGLDFDPIIDGQFTPQKGFEIEHIDSSVGYLFLQGVDLPDFKLTIKLAYQNSQWLVDGCGIINIPEEKRRRQ